MATGVYRLATSMNIPPQASLSRLVAAGGDRLSSEAASPASAIHPPRLIAIDAKADVYELRFCGRGPFIKQSNNLSKRPA
jgi:hypothetical protein